MMQVPIGTDVRFRTRFKNVDGSLFDPDHVVFRIKNPVDSVQTFYTYGTDVQLLRESAGVYSAVFTISASGSWIARFEGSGVTGNAASPDVVVKGSGTQLTA